MVSVIVDEFNHFELNFVVGDTELVKLESELDTTRTPMFAGRLVVESTSKVEYTRYGIVGSERRLGENRSAEPILDESIAVVEEDPMSR